MRLAFCVFKFFPFGGLERNCVRMAQVARDRGHDVDIYCYHWQGKKPDQINVIQLDARGLTNHGKCQSFVKQVSKILDEKHYNIVVGFNRMPGLDLFYAADVCYEHDVYQRRSRWYRLLPRYRAYAKFERAVFSPESHTDILSIVDVEKQYAKFCYHTPESRFHDVPPGISPDFIAPEAADEHQKMLRQKLDVPSDQHLVLFVGSDYVRKGLDRTLIALGSLPQGLRAKTCLWVIGQDDKAAYVKQAKQLNILSNIKFLGARHDMVDLLQAANMLIHPAYREATGGVLLEALAAGLPVLATDVCGFAFHVERAKAGILVASEGFDQESLNRALKRMLTADERQSWRQNALSYGRSADLYSRADRAVDIMERIARSS